MTSSTQFEQAIAYALVVHAGQFRSGTQMPMISHLLAVASLTLEFGGGETEAIAALLHDSVESGGGIPRLDDLRIRFGHEVAEIVEGCTDPAKHDSRPWQERKEDYVARVPDLSPAARFVSAADKLHNVLVIRRNLLRYGPAAWDCLAGGRSGRLWYYRALAHAFSQDPGPLPAELCRAVADLEAAATATESPS